MRLIHQFVGFITGIIMGVLVLITTIAVLGAYFITNDKDKKEETKGETRVTSTDIALDYEFGNRKGAEDVVRYLEAIRKADGYATLGDLKKILNIDSRFGDDKRGWRSFHGTSTLSTLSGNFKNVYPPIEDLKV